MGMVSEGDLLHRAVGIAEIAAFAKVSKQAVEKKQ